MHIYIYICNSFHQLFDSSLFFYRFVEILTVLILLQSSVNIFIIITLNALSDRLLIFIFLSSGALSYSFFRIIFLCLLILSSCSVYFYVFSRSAVFASLGEVAICRRCPIDHSSAFFSGHQNYAV